MIIAVYLVAGTADHFLHFGNLGLYGVANALLTVLLAIMLTRMGWWRRVGFASATPRQLLWMLPAGLPVVVNFYPGLAPGGAAQVVGFLVLALMVGFVEESAFRGVMLRALAARGVWRAVLVTSVLFSVTHLMNIMAGEAGLQAGLQLLYAGAIGFAFAALALRTSVIWPLVVVHALIDFVAFMQDPAAVVPPRAEVILDLTLTVVFLGYGAFLMLHSPMRTSATAPQAVPPVTPATGEVVG